MCMRVCLCMSVNVPVPLGYRYVHILSPSGEKLDQCAIFVHVKIENAADVVYEASPKLTEGGKAALCIVLLS